MPQKSAKKSSIRRVITPPSRNRDDILKQIKDEELLGSSVIWGGSLTWATTPEELLRLAEALDTYRKPGEGMFVRSYGCYLSIYRPGTRGSDDWEAGVQARGAQYAYPPTDVRLFTTPGVLKWAATQLEKAPWEKQKASCVYGSDRKLIKITVGDHIVTLVWTPPLDKEGVPQISEMHWGAWHGKSQREFAQEMRELEKERRVSWRRPGEPRRYGAAAR